MKTKLLLTAIIVSVIAISSANAQAKHRADKQKHSLSGNEKGNGLAKVSKTAPNGDQKGNQNIKLAKEMLLPSASEKAIAKKKRTLQARRELQKKAQ